MVAFGNELAAEAESLHLQAVEELIKLPVWEYQPTESECIQTGLFDM